MTVKRVAEVPARFGIFCGEQSKADLIEMVWDLMIQSPWFDEKAALNSVDAVCDQLADLLKSRKESRG